MGFNSAFKGLSRYNFDSYRSYTIPTSHYVHTIVLNFSKALVHFKDSHFSDAENSSKIKNELWSAMQKEMPIYLQ